jgi:hypothetical protein
MAIKTTIKRGDTYLVQGTVKNGALPQDITGWAIRSQVRDGSKLIAELLVTPDPDPLTGKYVLEGATENWPVKTLRTDVQYTTDAGQIMSTVTLEITVLPDVTEPL